MIQVTAAAVLDATRKYVVATSSRVSSWEIPQAVAREMGLWDDYAGARTSMDRKAVVAFCGQVTRALVKLTADGTVCKIGRDDKDPYGRTPTNEVWYYTPLAWQKALTDAAVKAAEAADARQQWQWIYDHLVLLGTHPDGRRGQGLTLSRDDLVLLIHRAED
jgi:hypothetical protein